MIFIVLYHLKFAQFLSGQFESEVPFLTLKICTGSIEIVPMRRTPIHQHTAPKRASASRIHQHTAPQNGVRL